MRNASQENNTAVTAGKGWSGFFLRTGTLINQHSREPAIDWAKGLERSPLSRVMDAEVFLEMQVGGHSQTNQAAALFLTRKPQLTNQSAMSRSEQIFLR